MEPPASWVRVAVPVGDTCAYKLCQTTTISSDDVGMYLYEPDTGKRMPIHWSCLTEVIA